MSIMNFFGRKMMQKVAADNTVHQDITGDFAVSDAMVKVLDYSAKNAKDLLDFALDQAIAITKSKIGYIYHYSETEKIFTLNTWSKEVMAQCTIQEKQTTYQLDKTGLWGEVVRQRKPIMLNEYHMPHPLKKGYPEGHAELHKFLSIPIFESDQIIMVVGVANKESDYDIDDVKRLNVFMVSVRSILKKFDLMQSIEVKEKKLAEDIQNIEKMNQLMVGRELMMVELKKKVDELEKKKS